MFFSVFRPALVFVDENTDATIFIQGAIQEDGSLWQEGGFLFGNLNSLLLGLFLFI
jgi:hypothetical protein